MSIHWERTPRELRPTGVRNCVEALSYLDAVDVGYFDSRYQIPPDVSRRYIRVAREAGRYALPIYGPDNAQRGVVLRCPWPGAPRQAVKNIPKADTYKYSLEPLQSHYWTSYWGEAERDRGWIPLVIVEDQLSAIKLAAYGYDSVAFLGVPDTRANGYSGADRVMEIARRAKDGPVIIALDSDATEAAFLFVRKWGHAFKSIRVAILSMDLKDTLAADFAQVLGA